MNKRRRMSESTNASISTTSTVIDETPHSEQITNSPDHHCIVICVGETHRYRVSKYVLTEVTWFKNFFSKAPESSTYYLPYDNPHAIRILFLICHNRSCLLPVRLELAELVELVTICRKYDVAHQVLPHVDSRRWIEDLWGDKESRQQDWSKWSQIIGELYPVGAPCQQLSTIVDVVAANMRMKEGRWFFEWSNVKHYTPGIDCSQSSPIDLTFCLEARRRNIWERFLSACNQLERTQLSKRSEYHDIGMLRMFIYELPEQVPLSNTMVAQFHSLLSKDMGSELKSLLQERLTRLEANK